MVRAVSDVHPSKAWIPIVVNAEGVVTVFNELHSINAASPIRVTDWGRVTEVRVSHPQNAPISMAVMEEGSINVDKFLFHCKARLGITLASYSVICPISSLPEYATTDTSLISKFKSEDIRIRMV